MRYFACLSLFLALAVQPLKAQYIIDSTWVDATVLNDGLDHPWEVIYGPDDMLWLSERYSRISRIDPETGQQQVVLEYADQVHQSGESGMLGMQLHPAFPDSPYVYVVYTYFTDTIYEKLVRLEWNGTELLNEDVLLDGIPGATAHDGSRLLMLPDNTLLMSTGDALVQANAQDPNSLSGKMLRLNLDGSIPADNPDPTSYVYTLGHRNAQGLCLLPDGTVISSEHGPATDDELNIIVAGKNYGWPNVHGYCDLPDEQAFCLTTPITEPIQAWTPTIATSDLIWYTGIALPEWTNSLLMTSLKDRSLYSIKLNDDMDEVLSAQRYFTGEFGRLRDITQGPDGELYLLSDGFGRSADAQFNHWLVKLELSPVQENINGYLSRPLEFYPSPASSYLHIDCAESLEGGVLKLYNATGQLVLSTELGYGGRYKLNLPSLATGIYVLQVQSETNRYEETLLIEQY